MRATGRVRSRVTTALCALLLLAAVEGSVPAGAAAEQASQPTSPAAGRLDAGGYHTCTLLAANNVRCWGFNGDGQLGYASTDEIGDDESPNSVGPVNLGAGRTAKAISGGDAHTCALLDDDTVRCWGFGGDGRLGYANTNDIRDPVAVGPVDLGPGRTAKAISAGSAHTCAVLDDDTVRCWGFGGSGLPRDGRLGYGNTDDMGDDEPPGSVGPVKLGANRRAKAITAGADHTCAVLDDNTIKCWGRNDFGQLGYGNTTPVGDKPTTTPDTVGPVNLGVARTARAISAGGAHTCALLDDATVRCWGLGGSGQLGYGNQDNIGDNETPGLVGPVKLGVGRTAKAITAGGAHTCAVLDDATVRCWGVGDDGRLGYGERNNIGDNELPDSVAPVNLDARRTATAITAGGAHTCARLDDATVRCWGVGANGRLGYCNQSNIGDDEIPGSVGPVALESPDAGCAGPGGGGAGAGGASATVPGSGGAQTAGGDSADPAIGSDARRARALRRCLQRAGRKARHKKRRARRACLKRYGRTPGRVTGLEGRAVSGTGVVLSFAAPGTDGARPPPASNYLVKQSQRPIRDAGSFARAQTLCRGSCRFSPTRVGEPIALTVTDLDPHTTYYYAVAARDNVSRRPGPRSATVSVRTP